MKVAQILLPHAPIFEQKCRLIDAANLPPQHDVVQLDLAADWERAARTADVVHIYGPAELPSRMVRRLRVPYVASGAPARQWLRWRNVGDPARRVEAYGPAAVPEAVELAYFEAGAAAQTGSGGHRVGTLARGADIAQMYHATVSRLARFRQDIDWQLLEKVPEAERMREFSAWVDPCLDPADLSGYTGEALVVGVPVIASRTPANAERLNYGAAGFLVPPGDANELTHAIVTALFKPEHREPRLANARATRDRFRPEHRMRRLVQIYQEVTGIGVIPSEARNLGGW